MTEDTKIDDACLEKAREFINANSAKFRPGIAGEIAGFTNPNGDPKPGALQGLLGNLATDVYLRCVEEKDQEKSR